MKISSRTVAGSISTSSGSVTMVSGYTRSGRCCSPRSHSEDVVPTAMPSNASGPRCFRCGRSQHHRLVAVTSASLPVDDLAFVLGDNAKRGSSLSCREKGLPELTSVGVPTRGFRLECPTENKLDLR